VWAVRTPGAFAADLTWEACAREASQNNAQIKGAGDERKKTGPLWIAGKTDYTFQLVGAEYIRAEVQKDDCKGKTGQWDTGSIAGGNVYDTNMDMSDKRNTRGQYHMSLQKGNGNYYFTW